LVPLYAAGLAAKDGLRAAGVLRTRKLRWPVISVGSLSAGGAGKTPVAIALVELLRERGWDLDVLSRGYGRSGSGVERVDSYTAEAALRFGDEPVLLAQRLRIPVWVGADRFAAGGASEATGAATDVVRGLHLLDDGFQHRGLARAVDIVLVTAEDLEEALLPAGNRREPWTALQRADFVVLREEECELIGARVRTLMREGAGLWTVRRTVDLSQAAEVLGSNGSAIAFCGIARPGDFIDTLRNGGVRVAGSIAFPDHHRYTAENMHQLTESLHARAGEAFITTEKDAVKLAPGLRAQLEAVAPVLVARLQAALLDPQGVVRELEGRLR
jgi:tetraacyldisaccharide 4'-kinase